MNELTNRQVASLFAHFVLQERILRVLAGSLSLAAFGYITISNLRLDEPAICFQLLLIVVLELLAQSFVLV